MWREWGRDDQEAVSPGLSSGVGRKSLGVWEAHPRQCWVPEQGLAVCPAPLAILLLPPPRLSPLPFSLSFFLVRRDSSFWDQWDGT